MYRTPECKDNATDYHHIVNNSRIKLIFQYIHIISMCCCLERSGRGVLWSYSGLVSFQCLKYYFDGVMVHNDLLLWAQSITTSSKGAIHWVNGRVLRTASETREIYI